MESNRGFFGTYPDQLSVSANLYDCGRRHLREISQRKSGSGRKQHGNHRLSRVAVRFRLYRGFFGDYFETFGAKKHRRDKAFAGNADCFIFHYRRYPYGGFDSFD